VALITRFVPASGSTSKIDPTTVTCEWHAFTTPTGPVLQLSTGGSATRQRPGKSSQKIQVDRAGAEELMKLLRSSFPGLSTSD
jgi:hypothetical protein